MRWPIPKISKTFKANSKQWTDWRWQLANTIKSLRDLEKFIPAGKLKMNQGDFDAMRLTPYLTSLINFKNKKDPILLQHIPSINEKREDNFDYNKIWEKSSDFLDGSNRFVQQKYPDIILLRVANTCHSFCRFCFEKERTLKGKVRTIITPAHIRNAMQIIQRKKVRQVLLSGGDPLILTDQGIKEIIEPLTRIPRLKTIRINTRTLLHNPYRITLEFARMLGELQKNSWREGKAKGKQIKIGLHFNHPNEITPESIVAMRRLQMEGIELYNQTVLLKGINDKTAILGKLFSLLREEEVALHYLSHAMPVPGTSHFITSINKGKRILEELLKSNEFRGQLPHYEDSRLDGKKMIAYGD